jgi:LPXTG-motif cell wall-anchored protein
VIPPTTTTPGTPTTDEITDIPETMPPLAGPTTNPPKTTEDPKTDPTEELVEIIDDDVPKAGPNTGDAGMGTALAMGAISLLGGVYVFKNKKR